MGRGLRDPNMFDFMSKGSFVQAYFVRLGGNLEEVNYDIEDLASCTAACCKLSCCS